MITEKRITSVINTAMEKISIAASNRDTSEITKFTRIAEDAEKLKSKLSNMLLSLEVLESEVSSKKKITHETPSENLRNFRIRVSQGMINQNLLTFTQQVKFGEIKVGEVLRVKTSEGGLFKSEILSQGNKLRERGQVGEFYKKAGIKADDFVELIEQKPSEWYLRPHVKN
ncbi:hypothetical protein [Cerasicoccus fimbriatus]|uniref:hypothetical protein n=1 Tax=Cerasicoccus fimbriatus TaxID=3014554 RepID=UPI0022B41C42|nr:hypothetical protein [Cerasicoccus sp. TK19100]